MPRKSNLIQGRYYYNGGVKWEITEAGFDQAVYPFWAVGLEGNPRSPSKEYPIGQKIPGGFDMYVTGVSYEYKNDGRVYADVTYKGIRREKGYKQSARAYSNKYTSENAFAGQPTAGLPTEISSPNLAVTSQYVITGTPNMTQVGKNRTPPDPPTPPTNPFIAVENATFAFPFGWVLENRSFERLANTDIYFMTDEYVYYFAYHP